MEEVIATLKSAKQAVSDFFAPVSVPQRRDEYFAWLRTVTTKDRLNELLQDYYAHEQGTDWDKKHSGLMRNPHYRFFAGLIRGREEKAKIKFQAEKGKRILEEQNNQDNTKPVSSLYTMGRDGILRDENGQAVSDQDRRAKIEDGSLIYSIPIASQHTGFTIHGKTYVMGARGGLLNQQGALYGGDELTANIARLSAEQALFTSNRERGQVDCPSSINTMLKGIRSVTNDGLANILTGKQQIPITQFLTQADARNVKPGDVEQVKEFLRSKGMGRLIAHMKVEPGAPIVKIDPGTGITESVEDFVWKNSKQGKAFAAAESDADILKQVIQAGGHPERMVIGGTLVRDAAEEFLKGVAVKEAGIHTGTSQKGVDAWIRKHGLSAKTVEVPRGIDISIGYESAHLGFDMDGRAANFLKLCFKQDAKGNGYELNETFTSRLPDAAQVQLQQILASKGGADVSLLMQTASDIGGASNVGLRSLRLALDSVLTAAGTYNPNDPQTTLPILQYTSLPQKIGQVGTYNIRPSAHEMGSIATILAPDGSIADQQAFAKLSPSTQNFLNSLNDEEKYALRLAADEDRARAFNVLDSSVRIQESPQWQDLLAKELICSANPQLANDTLGNGPFDRNNPKHADALANVMREIFPSANCSQPDTTSPGWQGLPTWMQNAILETSKNDNKAVLRFSAHLNNGHGHGAGELAQAFTSLVAPHMASVLADPQKCEAQMKEAESALRDGVGHTSSSIFIPLMKQGATGNWLLREEVVAMALDTNRLLAYQAEDMHIHSRTGLMGAYAPEHRNVHGLAAESTWMAKYLGHLKLIHVENGPADAGALVVDPKGHIAFNMGLDHPPADRLIKDNGDFRNLTEFLDQLPEHSAIVEGNYINSPEGLCFNKKIAYTDLEDNLLRNQGLAERLGISLLHRSEGIVPNSLNHMQREAPRLQTYLRETFERSYDAGPSGP